MQALLWLKDFAALEGEVDRQIYLVGFNRLKWHRQPDSYYLFPVRKSPGTPSFAAEALAPHVIGTRYSVCPIYKPPITRV